MGAVVMIGSPRGRQPTKDGRARFRMFPSGQRGSGRHLYALGLADGRTKIGIARRPRERICAHWVASDGAVTWAHVFGRVGEFAAVQIERDVLTFAAKVSDRIGRTETFRNLSRDEALRCVRRAMKPATVAGA